MNAPPLLLLSEDDAAAYVRSRASDIFGKGRGVEVISAERLTGGNLNFAFAITVELDIGWGTARTEQMFFLKQAPPYIAIFGPEGVPLTQNRIRVEHAAYCTFAKCLKGTTVERAVPAVRYYDDTHRVLVVDFADICYVELDQQLGTATLSDCDEEVRRAVNLGGVGHAIGCFLGHLHAATHASIGENKDAALALAHEFGNKDMRDIQVAYVFTKCFEDRVAAASAGLDVTDLLVERVDALKAKYFDASKGECLCHGDLHAGSVLANIFPSSPNQLQIKVVDMEFAVYGPAGLDIGSLFSSLILAAVHASVEAKPSLDRACTIRRLHDCAERVWQAYESIMLQRGVSAEAVRRISVDASGYAGVEVARTLLGFAGKRSALNEFSVEALDAAQRARGLAVAQRLILEDAGVELVLAVLDSAGV